MSSTLTLSAASRKFVLDTFFMRIVSFVLNQLIIRFANPVVIGVAAIQLELLLSSLLFLSREAIRLSLLRSNIADKTKLQQFVNISWIPALFILVDFIGCVLFVKSWSDSVPSSVIQLYLVGAFLEVCGEPFYNLYNHRVVLRPRVLAESFGLTARSVSTCIFVVYLDCGIVGFGYSQVCHSVVYFLTLVANYRSIKNSNASTMSILDFLPSYIELLPPKESSSSNKASPMKPLSYYALFAHQIGAENLQNVFATGPFFIFKHLLTEGDKIIMSSIRSNYDQGVYAILNNYVSLIARLVFYPVEESSRIAFAQMTVKIRNERVASEAHTILRNQCVLLYRLVLTLSIFGILFPLFGSNYARLFINLIFNEQWRSDETIKTLVAFCPYVLVLGVNGITEAYVHTVVPAAYFRNVNLNLFKSSVVFSLIALPLISALGTSGVVVANTLSMTARILLNYQLIVESFGNPSNIFGKSIDPLEGIHVIRIQNVYYLPRLDEFVPSSLSIVAIASYLITLASSLKYARSDMTLRDGAEHVSIGICCVAYFLFNIWRSYEHELDVIVKSFIIKKLAVAPTKTD